MGKFKQNCYYFQVLDYRLSIVKLKNGIKYYDSNDLFKL